MAVETIIDQLRAEETRLEAERAEIAASIKKVETDLKQVRGALRELGQKTGGKASKPAANKKTVIEAIAAVLTDKGVLEQDALKAEVEKRLTAEGRSRQGFALRFAEAIKDARFVDSPGGYRLASEPANDESQAVTA